MNIIKAIILIYSGKTLNTELTPVPNKDNKNKTKKPTIAKSKNINGIIFTPPYSFYRLISSCPLCKVSNYTIIISYIFTNNNKIYLFIIIKYIILNYNFTIIKKIFIFLEVYI